MTGDRMSPDLYLKTIRDMADYGVSAICLEGTGEPLLHKTTPEAVKLGFDLGVDMSMLSNGACLNEKNIPILVDNLTFLRFTINGTDTESYSQIQRPLRSEDWDRVRDNLENYANYRRKHGGQTNNGAGSSIGVYTIISEQSIPNLVKWVKEVKDRGADYIIIKPAGKAMANRPAPNRVGKETNTQKLYETLLEVNSLNSDDFKVQCRMDLFDDPEECYSKEYSVCYGLPFACCIDGDGSVYGCNWYWQDDDFRYGNLNEASFKEIWEGDRKKNIIDAVQNSTELPSGRTFSLEKCGACRQDQINRTLWNLKNPSFHHRVI